MAPLQTPPTSISWATEVLVAALTWNQRIESVKLISWLAFTTDNLQQIIFFPYIMRQLRLELVID